MPEIKPDSEQKWFLAETPKTYKPNLAGDTIWYQHPWILDADKRGKMVRRGLAKVEESERLVIQIELGKLLAAKPKFYANAPRGIRKEILEQYFSHLREALELPEQNYHDGLGSPVRISQDDKKIIREQEIRIAELEAECERLKRNYDAMANAAGVALDEEKETTFSQCWEHFEKRFQSREGAKKIQRVRTLGEVKKVLDAIGLTKKFAEIEKTDIEDAIKAMFKATAEEVDIANQKAKFQKAAKRFFEFLTLPKEDNGLAFRKNPAKTIKPKSVGSIQQMRINAGLVQTADPKPIIANAELATFWKTFAATLAYSGLRLSECAALHWNAIDFKKKTITIESTPEYQSLQRSEGETTNMKSMLSKRVVPPFKNLWPLLIAWQKVATDAKLVFGNGAEKLRYDRSSTWSGSFRDVLKARGLPHKEPAQTLRRFYETELRKHGYGDKASAYTGHEPNTGETHYSKWSAIAEKDALKMPTI